ncbi:MAG: tetratricopeptide repeat protein [Candidatus Methanofastidiosa archaeon]|nr:tetratricopeptide repeat protein [Candidatus Methanofastidiosa archaeon]
MTSDFKPGKAYLIKGKGIEQVKSEILDWLSKKGFQVEDNEDFIKAFVYPLSVGHSDENRIMLKQQGKDTLIIFHKKDTVVFSHLIRRNLVRSLSNKKEIPFEISKFELNFMIIFMVIMICLSVFMEITLNPFGPCECNDSKSPFVFLISLLTSCRYLLVPIIFLGVSIFSRIKGSFYSPNSESYVEEYKDLNMFKEADEFDLKRKFTCPNCNRSIKENWDKCLYCGIKLTSKKNVSLIFNNPRFYIAIVGVIVICLIVVASTIFAPNAEKYVADGVTLYNQGNYDESLVKFEKAIQIDPNNAYAWNGKGLCLNKKGKYSEAIECFGNALELDPNYAIAWFCKGLSLQSLGRDTEAQECFDKAKELGYKQS